MGAQARGPEWLRRPVSGIFGHLQEPGWCATRHFRVGQLHSMTAVRNVTSETFDGMPVARFGLNHIDVPPAYANPTDGGNSSDMSSPRPPAPGTDTGYYPDGADAKHRRHCPADWGRRGNCLLFS